MSFCTCCITYSITNYKTVEGSLYYYNYITVSYLCNCEVTEHHFQTINYKRKWIKAEILKTREEHL